jgi:L-ribulokinase
MTQLQPRYAVGVDYGTNSVRALVADCRDGREVATAVFDYPSGDRGVIVDPADPNLARQHPGDYIAGFETAVAEAVRQASQVDADFEPDRVVGLGVDTTGSTPLPVTRGGMPLGMEPEFRDEPAAQAWLWKDHTAHAEAAEITDKARRHPGNYLAKCGGVYSSEWYWSKILKCKRVAPHVFEAAYAWVELADFVPGYVTGRLDPETMARGICAAGHKAMFHRDWGGLPDADFLASLDPALVPLRDRYSCEPISSDEKVGGLTEAIAEKVGLPAGLPVAAGAFDAHHGAVGSGVGPGTLVKIMGTSTCDIMVAPGDQPLPDIPGVCGIVPGSVIPGMYGIEAGQSAVGDLFNWAVTHLTPGRYGEGPDAHAALTAEAEQLAPGASGLLALDWNNGNRTVLVDPLLTGLLVGQTLHTTAAEIYRTLVEATAFGALAIINRLEEHGVRVEQVVNCGGIAEKSPMAMQIYADVCNRPMKVSRASQTCALGAAIFGAVAGGAFADTAEAQSAMTGVRETAYDPDPDAVATYRKLFGLYTDLHDAFGTRDHAGSLGHVMKELIAIRDAARQDA